MRKRVEHKAQVLEYLRRHGPAVRSRISAELALGPPIAGEVVRDLLRLGVVEEDDLEASGGGRPRQRVRINPGYAAAIGVHVGMRGIRGGLVDLSGGMIAMHAAAEHGSGGGQEGVESIVGTVKALRERWGPRKLCGIGIGVSGVIGRGGRVSREFPFGDRWKNVPMADMVAERCGVRPVVMNDVHAAALDESRFGGWGDVRDMVLLHVGDGIAAGAVIDGRLQQGSTMNAGQVGHIVIREGGPLCYCGNRGCLESLASPRAMVDACREAVSRGVNTSVVDEADGAEGIGMEHIVSAGAKGDRLASNLLSDAGRYIGGVAASLINVFDPELFVLGGLLSRSGDDLVETIERTCRSRALPTLRDSTRIETSRLRESAPLLGAAVSAMDELFADAAALLAGGYLGEANGE